MQVRNFVRFIKAGDIQSCRETWQNYHIRSEKGIDVLRAYGGPQVTYSPALTQQLGEQDKDWLLYLCITHGNLELLRQIHVEYYQEKVENKKLLPLAIYHQNPAIVEYFLPRAVLDDYECLLFCAKRNTEKSRQILDLFDRQGIVWPMECEFLYRALQNPRSRFLPRFNPSLFANNFRGCLRLLHELQEWRLLSWLLSKLRLKKYLLLQRDERLIPDLRHAIAYSLVFIELEELTMVSLSKCMGETCLGD